MLRYLLPNAVAPMIVFVSLVMGNAILAEAVLSFLGLGIQPPEASSGSMLNFGMQFLRDASHLSTFLGRALFVTVLGFNLLGDGLRDTLDPACAHEHWKVSYTTLNTTYERIPVTTLASGFELFIPLHRLEGLRPGPTLGLSAVVHGDEPLTNEVIRQVLLRVDPGQLRGAILAVPVVNTLAFDSLTRHTPIDQLDLNRNFPGGPNGWLSEQIAHVLGTRFVSQLDAHVDLHTGGVFPTVDYVYIFDRSRELSMAFGSTFLFEPSNPYPGTFSIPAKRKGIPFFTAELGGGSFLDAHYIEHGVRGVTNVMKQLGMLDGEIARPPSQTVVTEMAVVRPHVGGMLHPEIGLDQLGKEVRGGTLLGRVLSPHTFETLEEIRAPFERGYLILLRGGMMRVHPGDYGYMVANAETARPS